LEIKQITVELRSASKIGAVKAYADVTLQTESGELILVGFSVIEKNGKPPWIGSPQRAGKIPGKYFPIVIATDEVQEQIVAQILEAYQSWRS